MGGGAPWGGRCNAIPLARTWRVHKNYIEFTKGDFDKLNEVDQFHGLKVAARVFLACQLAFFFFGRRFLSIASRSLSPCIGSRYKRLSNPVDIKILVWFKAILGLCTPLLNYFRKTLVVLFRKFRMELTAVVHRPFWSPMLLRMAQNNAFDNRCYHLNNTNHVEHYGEKSQEGKNRGRMNSSFLLETLFIEDRCCKKFVLGISLWINLPITRQVGF